MRWQKGVVEDFFDLRTGGTPSKSVKEYFENGAIPWLVSGDIHKWEINDCEGRISLEGLNNSNARWLPKGAVMMALNGQGKTRGTVALLEVEATCNQSLVAIIPRDKSILNSKFTLYQLHGKYQWLRKLTGDGGNERRGLNMRIIRKIPFDFPPLEEQERIVEILDEAFVAIDKAKANIERNLTNARELFQSRLNDIFSNPSVDWEVKPLGEICTIKHGHAFKSTFFSPEGDYVLLTPGNFHEEGGYRDRGEKTKYFIGEIPSDFILSKGDFLIAMTEQAVGLLGSSIVVPASNKFLHNQRLGKVQVNKEACWDNAFFGHQLNTRDFRNHVQDSASGTKVRHTSPKKLGAIKVVVPSLNVQENVADELNSLQGQSQSLEKRYRYELKILEELRQSILEQAFEGKLTKPVAA